MNHIFKLNWLIQWFTCIYIFMFRFIQSIFLKQQIVHFDLYFEFCILIYYKNMYITVYIVHYICVLQWRYLHNIGQSGKQITSTSFKLCSTLLHIFLGSHWMNMPDSDKWPFGNFDCGVCSWPFDLLTR